MGKHTDQRGNVWHVVDVSAEDQRALDGIRVEWGAASDEAIAAAKEAMLRLFPDPPSAVRGVACEDFIYLRTDGLDRHFFVPTSGQESQAFHYHCQGTGQADMNFAPSCTFDLVKMQYDGFLV